MSGEGGLVASPNLRDPDGFYAALIAAHESLPDEATASLLNARLVLILANHVGDPDVLREALALARAPLTAAESRPDHSDGGVHTV